MIYYSDLLPAHWIALGDDNQWYMWPASQSWSQRKPYRGHLAALHQASQGVSGLIERQINGSDDPVRLAPLLTLNEAARLLDLRETSTLRHAARDGRLQAIKLGRQWLVSHDEVARYARERKPKPRRPK